MSMCVDKTRHDNTALCVHEFGIRISLLHIRQASHILDDFAVDNDSAVLQIREFRISSDKLTVTY